MTVTPQQPGFTTSVYNSIWGVSRQVRVADPNDRTVSGGQTSQSGGTSSTSEQNSLLPSWRVRRFAAKAGLVGVLAALAFAPSLSSKAAHSPVRSASTISHWENTKTQDQATEINNEFLDLVASSLSGTRLDSMFTPSLQEQQKFVFAERTTRLGLLNGMNFAEQPVESATQEVVMRKAIYPPDLMKEYKELVREKHVGRLSVRQQKRMTELREKIQSLSRQDEHSQSAARQVKEINASLSDLRAKITARIAQRKAENQEMKHTS